jgi:hypothetical protein
MKSNGRFMKDMFVPDYSTFKKKFIIYNVLQLPEILPSSLCELARPTG